MAEQATLGTPVGSGDAVYHAVVDFLYAEADLLDRREHRAWLDQLTDDIRYVVPVRVTAARTLENSVLSDMSHFDEDRYSLVKRVERFETEHAWAEDPPSRTRRFVTNVRCWQSEEPREVIAHSNLLLFRSRGDNHEHDLLSGRRIDTLRSSDGALQLARREVVLDESVLRTQNLAVFL